MKYQFYINENFEIYTNEDIIQDDYGNLYKIIKFINHHKRKNKKEIYLVVNLQDLKYTTKKISVPVEHLSKYYKKV